MRLLKRGLKRIGIPTTFSGAVCPEHIKTITIDAAWRPQITVRQTLVFLDRPDPGDLFDTCAVAPGTALKDVVLRSPDATETTRAARGRDRIRIGWQPRDSITRYALYDHQYSWYPAESGQEPAFVSELSCEMKTGVLALEIVAPAPFEAAVVFERPRWFWMNTEHRLMKRALALVGRDQQFAPVVDQGRVEWKLPEPRAGVRYVCVAFQLNGAAAWRDRLKAATFGARARQLVGWANT